VSRRRWWRVTSGGDGTSSRAGVSGSALSITGAVGKEAERADCKRYGCRGWVVVSGLLPY
jgi:hypothetical protein